MRTRSRALFTLAMFTALAVMAAACGGDDGGADPGAGEVDAPPTSSTVASDGEPDDAAPEPAEPDESEAPEEVVLTDSFRGVTAEEIRIGVVIVDVEVVGRSNGDVEAKWDAAIDAVNADGGVLGRNLVPVFARYSPLGEVETEAACVKLTQDEQVFAAMGPLLSNLTCFTDVNDTIFINTFGVSQEEFERSTAVAIGPGALPARTATANIEALIGAGALGAPVAVHGAADAGGERGIYVDALSAAGVNVVSETESTVVGDVVAAEAEMQSFAQRWEADGAEIVLAVGAGSGINVVAGLDRGGFEPAVVLTNPSDFDPQLYRDLGYTTGPLEGATALGFDTFEDLAEQGAGGVPECIAQFEAASGETVNVRPEGDEPVNLNTTVWACQAIDIFVQIAAAAGADLTNDSFRAAAEAGLELTVTAASPASIGAGKFDIGDSAPVVLVFDVAADDFSRAP